MSPRGKNGRQFAYHYDLDGDEPSSRFDEWEVDPELAWDAIRAVIGRGDGILFRATSDGGAVQVTIYRPGEDPIKKYVGSVAALTTLLGRVRGNPLG